MSTTTSDKFVRDMLLKGRSIDFVADASGYPREAVAQVMQQLLGERDEKQPASNLQTPAPAAANAESDSENSEIIPGQSADNAATLTESDKAKPSQLGNNLASTTSTSPTESDNFPETSVQSNGHRDLPEMREQARQIVQPRPEFKQRVTNAVELLARADHIDDRRVQAALGRARKAMTDLASQVQRYESQDEARARIAELEEELRAARAALRGSPAKPRGGGGISDDQRAKMLAGQRNETPCEKGCGFVAKTKSGKSAHERNCTGAVATAS